MVSVFMEQKIISHSSPAPSESFLSQDDRDMIHQIKGLFALFAHTLAAMRLYPSRHENVTKISDDFYSRLSQYLEDHGELEIGIEENAFTFNFAEGETFREESGLKSLPYLFFKDGMRSLTFLPGLSRGEFLDFMEIVKTCAELPYEESDIVDQLWERDLEHLRYDAPEEFLEAKMATRSFRPNEIRVDRTSLYTGLIKLDSSDRAAVYSRNQELNRAHLKDQIQWSELPGELDQNDLTLLETMLTADRGASAVRELIETMFEILYLEDRIDPFLEILAFLKSYLRTLIDQADMVNAVLLMDSLTDLRDILVAISPERVDALKQALGRMIEEADLKALRDIARPGRIDDPRWLFEFIARFGTLTLPLGADIYDAVLDPVWREAGFEYLRIMIRNHPSETAALAQERKPALTKTLISLLGERADRKAILQLTSFARASNPEIRREAVHVLGTIDDDLARKALLEYLHDSDELIRIDAFRSARLEIDQRTLDQALKEALGKSFHDRSPAEKEALLTALGRTNTSEAAAVLRTLLLKKRLFSRERVRKTRLLAVTGLAAMTIPDALETLRIGAGNSKPTISAACAQALRSRKANQEEIP